MSLVLAIEPDSSQADPLNSFVRAKLGAELQMVTSAQAAIVAMNQRVPDVVLLGRGVLQNERAQIVSHLGSLTTHANQARTIDLPQFANGALWSRFQKKIGEQLGAAADARVRQVATALTEPAVPEGNAVALEESKPQATPALHIDDSSTGLDSDIRAADLSLIEAEVEYRLKSEVERLQAEAARQQARELARVEAEAAEHRAREIARVEAETARQRADDLARIESEAAQQRESAVVEARAAAEATARETLVTELERVRREAEQHLASEIRRVRSETEQALATKLNFTQAQARAEAEALRAAAIEQARQVVEEAAARAKDAEEEVARVRAEAGVQLKEAVARARAESEAQLQEQVARAQAETEARLEQQLASVIGEAEQVRHLHRQATFDADQIRTEAAQAARAAAEAALAAETERIRREANQRLEAEIARLRTEAARSEAQRIEDARFAERPGVPERASLFSFASQLPLHVVRWDIVATAAVILLVVITGLMYLPRAVSTAAKSSSALAGTAGNAAKQAVAAAPGMTRRAIATAERALPKQTAKGATKTANGTPADVSVPASDTGPGFIATFARIPMDVYADGKRIGTTEDGQLLLNSGTHRIEFVSERYRYRSTINMTVRPGRVAPYTVPIPAADVHVTTTPGSEVWVEGKRAGIAPLDAIQVPIGMREIVVKDSSGTEKRKWVEVKYGETVEVSLAPEADAAKVSPSTPRLAPLSRAYP
jgi:hypothetical protein